MTRINVGIEPFELPDKLLIAEHREITRIPNAVRSGRAKLKNLPLKFGLGTGHVRFFYDKLGYLEQRYLRLLKECQRRGFNVTDKRTAFHGVPLGQWYPDNNCRKILKRRIASNGHKLITGLRLPQNGVENHKSYGDQDEPKVSDGHF